MMSRLELGKQWLGRFCRILPNASTRMTTRMAWHLAALSIQTDEDLSKLPDAALVHFAGGSRHFLGMRDEYLHVRSLRSQSAATVPAFVRHARRSRTVS